MSTWSRLDLQTLGCQPMIMPEISPNTALNFQGLLRFIESSKMSILGTQIPGCLRNERHGVVSLKSYFIIDLRNFGDHRLISLQIGSGIGSLGAWELYRNRSLVTVTARPISSS
jgi:hypothetical protein